MKCISLDFEFRGSADPRLDLVAAVLASKDFPRPRAYWLYSSPDTQARLKTDLESYRGAMIISYSCASEARSLQALGLNPMDYNWYDPMIAFRLAINAPHVKRDKTGLIEACKRYSVEYRHPERKKEMRDLILTSSSFSTENAHKILKYCAEDVICLQNLFYRSVKELCHEYKLPAETVISRMQLWSKYSAAMGMCETVGMPVNQAYLSNLKDNYKHMKFWFCQQISYPFYQFSSRKDDYVFKHEIFSDYLLTNQFDKFWPKTECGEFSTKKDTLKDWGHVSPELMSLQMYKPIIDTIKYFNPQGSVFSESIGSDSRSRTYFNPYGSWTGRNQPPASKFLLLMPSAFRCIIRPPEGYSITSIDWSSQEFVLGAVLSGDQNMLAAYNSGDPYMFFAKAAGAVPADGNKTTHSRERNLFKSTVLGLQYGMGAEKLHLRLSRDTGQPVSVAEAKKLIDLHKSTFKGYWAWLKTLDFKAKLRRPFNTVDGWMAHSDPSAFTSMRNYPIQGSGASLLRLAVIKAVSAGLPLMCPHHDALYLLHKSDDRECITKLKACMDSAVKAFFKDTCVIRNEVETHDSEHDWVEPRAQKIYEQLVPFLKEYHPERDLAHVPNAVIEWGNLFEEAV